MSEDRLRAYLRVTQPFAISEIGFEVFKHRNGGPYAEPAPETPAPEKPKRTRKTSSSTTQEEN
jgi:hypothetical protein